MTEDISVSIIEKEPITISIADKEPISISIIEKEIADVSIISPGNVGPVGPRGEPLSVPPPGCRKVINLYVNEAGKFIIEHEDTPV